MDHRTWGGESRRQRRDAEDRVIDSETRVVQVPAMSGTSLLWGSPVLLRGRTPREIRALADDLDAPPFAGHEFTRADRLLVRTPLFGDAAEATITARLTGRQGQRLVALPVAPLAGREGSYQIDLPLSSVAPGDYVIAVEASKGGERAEAFVAIRVSG